MAFLIKGSATSYNLIYHCCPVSLAEVVYFDHAILKALSPILLIICSKYFLKLKMLYWRHMILMHCRHNIYFFLDRFFPWHSYILPHAERTHASIAGIPYNQPKKPVILKNVSMCQARGVVAEVEGRSCVWRESCRVSNMQSHYPLV